jgi:putative transposase
MPWRHTSPMDPKTPFIAEYLRRTLSRTAVCALDGVSRQTGDKWIERSRKSGPLGLEERSRPPCFSPRQRPQHVVEALIARRHHPPAWGATTRLAIGQQRPPRWP